MNYKFSIAPCSWGIEDPKNPDNPIWSKVLDDAGKSGFTGIELGPYGYLPGSPSKLLDELASRSLRIIAGTIYDDLSAKQNRESLVQKTKDICSLISSVNEHNETLYLVIIDAVKEMRNNTAGHSELAQRLENDEWKIMMENIRLISEAAYGEYGVKPVVHPHAGGFLEFRDETDRFLNDIPPETANLCLDTGHIYYAGEKPAESLIELSERLEYMHFKDINPDIYPDAIKKQMGFFDACNLGVMCSIGRGCVDYSSVFSALDQIGYKGWITIEQERDPRNFAGALDDVKQSHRFLMDTLNT